MTKNQNLRVADAEVIEDTPAKNALSVRQDTGVVLSVIEKMAAMEDLDLDRMEQMLNFKRQLDQDARADEDRNAKKAFMRALTEAQSEIPVVFTNRANTFNNTRFADLAAIENAVMPVVRSHGFNVSARSMPGAAGGMQRIVFRVAHIEGHVDEFEDDFPLDSSGTGGKQSKTDIQAKGSTTTYARRYMLCGYFNIAISDSDGAPKKPAAPLAPTDLTGKEVKRLRNLIIETAADEVRFLKNAKAADLESINPADFKHLESLLLRKKAEIAAASKKSEDTAPVAAE